MESSLQATYDLEHLTYSQIALLINVAGYTIYAIKKNKKKYCLATLSKVKIKIYFDMPQHR